MLRQETSPTVVSLNQLKIFVGIGLEDQPDPLDFEHEAAILGFGEPIMVADLLM
jgi:hypothetical protein